MTDVVVGGINFWYPTDIKAKNTEYANTESKFRENVKR